MNIAKELIRNLLHCGCFTIVARSGPARQTVVAVADQVVLKSCLFALLLADIRS